MFWKGTKDIRKKMFNVKKKNKKTWVKKAQPKPTNNRGFTTWQEKKDQNAK